uniref:phospholipase A2, minor isoenzyme-like isoform X2 n=1 Tax=Myxine glutinosa TaxID=7769 RepID=UPI00358F5583
MAPSLNGEDKARRYARCLRARRKRTSGLAVARLGSLLELREVFICKMPDVHPAFDFTDYGCYCGLGGSGTPLDNIDRCCQTHDNCYSGSDHYNLCNPYLIHYTHSCDNGNNTCPVDKNNACEQYVCECDKTLVDCISKWTYHPEYFNVDLKKFCPPGRNEET